MAKIRIVPADADTGRPSSKQSNAIRPIKPVVKPGVVTVWLINDDDDEAHRGWYGFRSPYDSQLVDDIKSNIPYYRRAWNGAKRVWKVHSEFFDAMVAILQSHFRIVTSRDADVLTEINAVKSCSMEGSEPGYSETTGGDEKSRKRARNLFLGRVRNVRR